MYLLANGKLITRDSALPYLSDGGVVIDGTRIVEVGKTTDLKNNYPQAEFIDARGGVIMPGIVNTHTHIYSAWPGASPSTATTPPRSMRCWTASGGISTGT